VGNAHRWRETETALAQLSLQLFDVDPLSSGELRSTVRPRRPTADLRIGTCHADTHRGTPFQPDEHEVVAPFGVYFHRGSDGARDPAAVAPKGGGVKLLLHRPEAMKARESELRTWHLLDAPASGTQILDERRVDARSSGASVNLRILVQQAMRDECDTGHA